MGIEDRYRQEWEAKQRQSAERHAAGGSLKGSGGDGTSGGVEKTDLKTRVDFLHTAYIALVAALILVTVAALGATALASSGTNGRIDRVASDVSSLNREVGSTNAKLDEANHRLDRIEQKLDQLLRGSRKP